MEIMRRPSDLEPPYASEVLSAVKYRKDSVSSDLQDFQCCSTRNFNGSINFISRFKKFWIVLSNENITIRIVYDIF